LKLLKMILFISFNNFWKVGKLNGFGKKLLGTLGKLLLVVL